MRTPGSFMRGTPDAYPFPTLSPPLRFAIALRRSSLVFASTGLAGATIDDGSQFLLLGTAVLGAARGSPGPGRALAATVLGAVLGAFDASRSTSARRRRPHPSRAVRRPGPAADGLVAELRAARRSAEEQARRRAGGAPRGRSGEPDEGRVPRHHLARAAHAAQRRPRLGAPARTGKLDRGDRRRGLESIERNVRLQAQLTGDLLDVSKALTGELQLDSAPVAARRGSRGEAVAAGRAAATREGRRR